MGVVGASFGNPLGLEEGASAPLAGGLMNRGFQCGMLWGASLAAGAEAYLRFGAGPGAEVMAISASGELVDTFRTRTQDEINCTEITEINFQEMSGFVPVLKFLVKGGKIGPGACFRLSAGYAQDAFNSIDAALSKEPNDGRSQPVSCAALCARKLGADERHVVMVSGFAGGIGLSGGGCGALGAAIWLAAMEKPVQGTDKLGYFNNPVYTAVIDRFVGVAGGKFECREIVGRVFESIDDHAVYLREGGCTGIFEALVTDE